MSNLGKAVVGLSATGLIAGALAGAVPAQSKEITIRIGSGHPPTVVYAGLMKTFFQPELKPIDLHDGIFGLLVHVPVLILVSLLTAEQDPDHVEAYVNPPLIDDPIPAPSE